MCLCELERLIIAVYSGVAHRYTAVAYPKGICVHVAPGTLVSGTNGLTRST